VHHFFTSKVKFLIKLQKSSSPFCRPAAHTIPPQQIKKAGELLLRQNMERSL
jgi:hypothetical protein